MTKQNCRVCRGLAAVLVGCLAAAGVCGVAVGRAGETMEIRMTLRDLGERRAERLQGTTLQRDYFFALPVRRPMAGLSKVRFVLTASKLLQPQSTVALKVNDVLVAEMFVVPEKDFHVLEALLPAAVFEEGPAGDFLKVTLAAELAPPPGMNRCQALAAGVLWVEVQPESEFVCVFRNDDPDWLAIARLPFTLRNELGLEMEGAMEFQRVDMLLKLAAWLAYTRPQGRLASVKLPQGPGYSSPQSRGALDVLVLGEAKEGETGGAIRVEADGVRRRVVLRGSSEEDCRALWTALRRMHRHRLPGREWERLLEADTGFFAQRVNSVVVESLSPGFTGFNRGIGGLARSFTFDVALFPSPPSELLLRLVGKHKQIQRAGSASLMVFQNERLVFTQDLALESRDFDLLIPLDVRNLLGQNTVRVAVNFTPTGGECETPLFDFFWQLDAGSSLLFRGDAPVISPQSLLVASQWFYGRASYDVLLQDRGTDLPAALQAVSWLQKVNASAITEPSLAEMAQPGRPVVAVGNFEQPLPGLLPQQLDAPVVSEAAGLRFTTRDGEDFLQIFSPGSAGIFQLAYRGLGQPVLWASSWGPDGRGALLRLMAQMADLPWFGDGDVVLGDGVTPILAMSSTDAPLQEVRDRSSVLARLEWMKWRWWIVGALWVLLTAVVVWIFTQSRRHSGL